MRPRWYLKYRHGISAWDGELGELRLSMYRAALMPFCLWCWRDHDNAPLSPKRR